MKTAPLLLLLASGLVSACDCWSTADITVTVADSVAPSGKPELRVIVAPKISPRATSSALLTAAPPLERTQT